MNKLCEMKFNEKSEGIRKGRYSGLLASVLFHGAIFFIAGLFVVFTVARRPEPEFAAPPPIERPQMKLKKPKVKVQKNSNPKPSSRIVAKVKTKQMPEIRLPDLQGQGEGLMGGVGIGGEFLDLPDINSLSLLGSSETVGTDLVGVYYDLKRTAAGNIKPCTPDFFYSTAYEFIHSGWDTRRLSKFYRLPKKLYATMIVVPVTPSSFAPVAFGEVDAAEGSHWLVLYKGKLVHKNGITFRFWAAGDALLVVRIDEKIVVAGVWDTRNNQYNYMAEAVGSLWTSKSPESRKYVMGLNCLASVSEWITLEPGEEKDIEILLGDQGGLACAYLAVEEKGIDYPTSSQGGPILPAFKTAEVSQDLIDVIYPHLAEDEMISLTNGPIFNDL